MNPLSDLLVLDFSQFLAGPSASLRLADLGARVIKIERPGTGEAARDLSIANVEIDGESVLFHTINRNKESYSANLKASEDLERITSMVKEADVLIESFRPDTMEKLGLGYETLRELNPGLVYTSITGYGQDGPWSDKPGQDLLVQSISGLPWLNGDADQPPVPFGLAVVDMLTGENAVHGILACLRRRQKTGVGGRVDISLMESALDFQFDVLTTHLNDGGQLPQRSEVNNAHAYLGAPYGIYETEDGYLALAMGSVKELGELLDCSALEEYEDPETWFEQRDEIKAILVDHLKQQTTDYWLDRLEPADYWCSDVLTWPELMETDAFQELDMIQRVQSDVGIELDTLRCPIHIDDQLMTSSDGAPSVGGDNDRIDRQLDNGTFPFPNTSDDNSIAGGSCGSMDKEERNSPRDSSQDGDVTEPLSGLTVVDFSQFLAGPYAGLRLADLGARVIKVERPETGDLTRQLYCSNVEIDGDSTLFHAINRNKESIEVNLQEDEGRERVLGLLEGADVVLENFRPGTMEKFELNYDVLRQLNPELIYGSISGYGREGPWRDHPGQDLLVQSRTGLPWLNGNADQPPVPFGLSICDMMAGSHLVQGILAILRRRRWTEKGGRVDVSLMESALDLQFEVLTTHLNDGGQLPQRSEVNNAHAYLGAPYGIYETEDGYLALAMGSVKELGELLDCSALEEYEDPDTWFEQRDEIKSILVDHLKQQTTDYWLDRLEPADYWCSDVLTWPELMETDAFQELNMIQHVRRDNGAGLDTLRCPIRIDGQLLTFEQGAPRVGEHTNRIFGDQENS